MMSSHDTALAGVRHTSAAAPYHGCMGCMALLQTGTDLALATVQLRHEMPDGSRHIDWMTARDTSDNAPLLTFRLPGPVDQLAQGREMPAEHIGDHRRAYLEYEGPISGGRGEVTRVSAGHVTACSGDAENLQLHLIWGDREQSLSLQRQKSNIWLVRCADAAIFR